jgi:hypothetical protein
MSCKEEWGRKFIVDNFEKTYVAKGYTALLQNVLLEKETALLPATQPYVEKELQIVQLEKDMTLRNPEEQELIKKLNEIQIYKAGIQTKIYQLRNKDIKNERREFIRKCPNGDCHGFLSTSLKCEMCGIWACGECREIKGNTRDTEHTCCPNILANVKMMENDTKPCPKCACMIHKIEGCDQMFCTMCHTAFSWRTLRIETGIVHNPHYFQWQRQQNNGAVDRNPEEVICGREIDNNFVRRLDTRLKTIIVSQDILKFFNNLCRYIIHIRLVEVPNFRVNNITENLDLRVKYMMNELNKETFKSTIQKREKTIEKKNEIMNLLAMYVNCMTDILYRLYENINEHEAILIEMQELRTYVNTCFKDISKYYSCVQYTISDKFDFGSVNVINTRRIQQEEYDRRRIEAETNDRRRREERLAIGGALRLEEARIA